MEGEFGGVGEPARNVTYPASVTARADETQIQELMRHTPLKSEKFFECDIVKKVS